MPASKVPYLPRIPGELALALFEIAAKSARDAAKAGVKKLRKPHSAGQTLRPGVETPLWTEIVRQARPHLHHRGTKASLARVLGIPRQRLHVCLTTASACLDAERALLLLCWVAAKQQGRQLFG
jgi:hypothetical protein